VANVTNNTATVVINKTSIQIIHYSYFQIGALAHSTPSSTNNTNSSNSSNAQSDANTAAPEKSNYIGIIAGIIAGVAVVAVAVVIVIKCYFKNTIYHIPEKDDFRILPTLSV
jgi:type IV secretory pathway TrbL component